MLGALIAIEEAYGRRLDLLIDHLIDLIDRYNRFRESPSYVTGRQTATEVIAWLIKLTKPPVPCERLLRWLGRGYLRLCAIGPVQVPEGMFWMIRVYSDQMRGPPSIDLPSDRW